MKKQNTPFFFLKNALFALLLMGVAACTSSTVVVLPTTTPSSAESILAAPTQAAEPLPIVQAYQEKIAQALQQPIPIMTLEGLSGSAEVAQRLALQNPKFTEFSRDPRNGAALRSEIFAVYPARPSDLGPDTAACPQDDCFRVEMYNFAYNVAITAIVNVPAGQVVAVNPHPNAQPDIPDHLKEIATQIALNSAEVAQELGFKPDESDAVMANSLTALNNTRCERSKHLCVAPTFVREGEEFTALWAIVDLTEFDLVGVRWTNLGKAGEKVTEQRLADEAITANYCQRSNTIQQDGWRLDYIITTSDGLRVSDVTFQDRPVLRSAKLVDWHVSYSQRDGFGYSDAIGCPTFSSAAVIPWQSPYTEPLLENGQTVGFVLVQTFRSDGWPQPCNYSYDQRYEFYQDGRFRVKTASHGRGCGDDGMYRPVLRIEFASLKQGFAEWTGSKWQNWEKEGWQLQSAETPYTPEGYQYRLDLHDGSYYIEPSHGQFSDGGRGDNAYTFVTRLHNDKDEGSADMLTVGPCCNEDHQQGPEKFIEDEPIQQAPLVLWYVPQMKNDDDPADPYCWADTVVVNGVYEIKTWPCYAGPMFIPAP